MQQMFFIAVLIACSTCFGHHYAHHQELESIVQLVAACGVWCLVFKLSVWCGAEGCVSGLQAASCRYGVEDRGAHVGTPVTTRGLVCRLLL
jgi:hypothetical protein